MCSSDLSFIIYQLSRSREIAIATSLLTSTLPWLIMKERQKRAIQTREALWPEVIESVISALYAGRSINQALMDLQNYGPQELAHVWQRMSARISEGDSLEKIFSDESRGLESPRADQFFATLIFAKNFGGHSVQLSLRHLAAFIQIGRAHV